jgi:hypothetical protein
MLLSPAVLPLVLLLTANVNPAAVPSQGKQASIITIEKPGMYRITAESPGGTRCEIVDHLRGPFSWSGAEGRSNCKLDLLLDAGVYKLRLRSPKKGKGQVKIQAKPFEEINQKPVRIEDGRSVEQSMRPGQQASYWIRVPKRRWTTLRVMGRTAGDVRLWRDGQWVEEIQANRGELMPKDGQPIYEWHVSGLLEAGDYLLTAYGANPKKWTQGKQRDFLFVANGFPQGPPDRAVAFSLPPWGKVAYQVPKGRLVAFLSLDQAQKTETRVQVARLVGDEGVQMGAYGGAGRIVPKALIPTCSASSNYESRHVIQVAGSPGTTGTIEWGVWSDNYYLLDGSYTSARETLAFGGPAGGDFLVAVHDVPADIDAAPLSCRLDSWKDVRRHLSIQDYLKVGRDRAYRRAFNYNGREETIWFQVTDAGVYAVSTRGDLKNRCVLYELDRGRHELVKDTDPGAKECRIQRHLSPGYYELKIYRGREGIENLTIAQAASRPGVRNVTKNSCMIPSVRLENQGRYKLLLNRAGDVTARGLVLRSLPLKLERPLPVVLDAGEQVEFPVAPGGEVLIRSAGGSKFSCSWKNAFDNQAREGRCLLPVTKVKMTLVIKNPNDAAMLVSVRRPKPKKPRSELRAHSPKIRPLPRMSVNRPKFFDFDRSQSHSMIFDVKKAGLYHVTTQGLLGTECRMRTAVVPRLVSDTGSGRGRNCLIAKFLRPGRYLLSVKTTGRSKGRAAVLLSKQTVRKARGLKKEGEVFFTVAANELIRQDLAVKQPGKHRIRTGGQGVSLQCRLDDRQGWPLIQVPAGCTQTLELDRGTYRWTQLPLTVESMRRTQLEKVRRPLVLRGERKHSIRLNTWYDSELSKDGKDEFVFTLRADLDVSVSLNQGMQGRLYRIGEKSKELVDPIPPNRGAVPVKLVAGRYLLRTEHSRADVGIGYCLHIKSSFLAPGLGKDLQVPSAVGLRIPKDSVLRLKTTGECDVRCRLFGPDGVLVAESGSHGADWNCLIATPLSKGDYRLVLEAENTIRGHTHVSVAATETQYTDELKDDRLYRPSGKVLIAKVPRAAPGEILELDFKSKLTFSCALEEEGGGIISHREDVRRCLFLVNPKGKRYQVHLWSKNWFAKIRSHAAARKIVALSGKTIPRGKAALTSIPRAGRYQTAKEVWCLPEAEDGLMRWCGPEASLEPVVTIFTTAGPKNKTTLKLDEKVFPVDRETRETVSLGDRQQIARQKSKGPALHLLRVELPPGEPVAPACRIEGGIHELSDRVCLAASAPTRESLSRIWVPSRRPFRSEVTRHSARVPKKGVALKPGIRRLVWRGAVVRLAIPKEPCRIELTLPHDGWAVQTDAGGAVVDLCAPRGRLYQCVLGGSGGEVFVASNAERRATVRVIVERQKPLKKIVRTLFEEVPRGRGRVRLEVPAADAARKLVVEGAERCVIATGTGARMSGCRGTLPAGQSAEVMLFFDKKPLRVLVYAEGQDKPALWNRQSGGGPGPSPLLAPGRTLQLDGTFKDANLVLEKSAVVRLHSDSGVCALAGAKGFLLVTGMGAGCDVYRLLDPGSYRFMVRSFADEPLSGSLGWTAEPVKALQEGVGAQYWLAPGESRIFRFETESEGEIGLGLQVAADTLRCTITDTSHNILGEGCQQFLEVDKSVYLLHVSVPGEGRPAKFRPVILGLSGSKMGVPEEYLRDFFRRIGGRP